MSGHRPMRRLTGCAGALCVALSGSAFAAEATRQHPDAETLETVDEEHGDSNAAMRAEESYHAAIGRLIGSMICGGALVLDPRIVITAAHCVVLQDGEAVAAHIVFQPGQKVGAESVSLDGSVWALGSPHQHGPQLAHDASNDWAIGVLDQMPVGIVPLQVRSHSVRELEALVRRVVVPIVIAGSGASISGPACSVLGILSNLILHDCRISRGGSGLPLLVRDRERLAVLGVHTGEVALRPAGGSEIVPLHGSAVRAISFLSALRDVHRRLLRQDRMACARAC